MAVIRREDKEIIHNLSLLGMLFGAFVGGFLTMHWHKQAHLRQDAEAAATRTHNSLVRLSSNLSEQEASVAQAAMNQAQLEIEPVAEPDAAEGNFWTRLPRWGLWGVWGGAILVGGGAGYLSLWGAGWLGSLLTYWAIRGVYRAIRKTAPDSQAARRAATAGTCPAFARDDSRLLPTLIKLFMLLLMALSVLAVVVWHLIGL